MKNYKIKEYIEDKWKINLSEENRKSYPKNLRSIYYILCLKYNPNATYESIGSTVNRTHASVLNGFIKFSYRLESNLKCDEEIKSIYKLIHDDFYNKHFVEHPMKDYHTKNDIILMRKIESYRMKIENMKLKLSA